MKTFAGVSLCVDENLTMRYGTETFPTQLSLPGEI